MTTGLRRVRSGSAKAEHRGRLHFPSAGEFRKGIEAYARGEHRDAMYRVATFLVSHFWAKPSQLADSLGVLLLTWNQAFYRYGLFDFDVLEDCIVKNRGSLERFRKRKISSFSKKDEHEIRGLFERFLRALAIASGTGQGRRSPVAVAKALHLLAPGFFPLWDKAIAHAYGCDYHRDPATRYLAFCGLIRNLAPRVARYRRDSKKTLLKTIDEYNYAKYTEGWIVRRAGAWRIRPEVR